MHSLPASNKTDRCRLNLFPAIQKALEALVRAQARLDHARNGAAAKAAARDAASQRRTDVETELQVGQPLWCERPGDQ